LKKNKSENLVKLIEECCLGLTYLSETNADFTVFVGEKVAEINTAEILRQTKNPSNSFTEQRDFNEFFSRLTKVMVWFAGEEKQMAVKFSKLQNVLLENLKNIKIFRIGKIRIDIYIVGLDADGNLIGVKTKAVET
jgi:hypothetical protein